jgi:hypothetical protein
MSRFAALVAILGSLLLFAEPDGKSKKDKKNKVPKPPELEVVSLHAARGGKGIELEVKVTNSGVRPLNRVTLVFEFRETEGRIVSAREIQVDQLVLAQGDETELNLETPDQVRAVHVTVAGRDKEGRELVIAQNGPFPIE